MNSNGREHRRVSRYFDVRRDEDGREYMEAYLDGIALMRLVLTNKGTAFTPEEREELGLEGLLPPQVNTLEQQVERVYTGYLEEKTDLGRYQYLRQLQERQEVLFYALLERHLEEMMPIVYTPTVGEAVRRFSAMYQNPRGISFAPHNIDRARAVLDNYPFEDIRLIVATDASAILGMGDQGYGGLAISIGKLALYTVGGMSPFHTMPVALDVGTDRADLLGDAYYLGARQGRLRGASHDAFVERFVSAVHARWPGAIIQWEDLAKDAAFGVLERYRDRVPSFNDDIQGTGAVALAGLLVAARRRGRRLADETYVVHGAGAGGIGVARAIEAGLCEEGLSSEEARARIFVLDSKGLLVEGREIEGYKRPFLAPQARIAGWKTSGPVPTLLDTVRGARATVLLGLSGQPGAFDETLVRVMLAHTEAPVVFALSNPTSSCEAKPADVLAWSDGRAVVATGSPFDPVDGVPIGQGNNAFVFPGIGIGASLCRAARITDAMILEAAHALADYTESLGCAAVYPPVTHLREVSVRVATRVVARAVDEGVARREPDRDDLQAWVREQLYFPRYLPIVRGETCPAASPRPEPAASEAS